MPKPSNTGDGQGRPAPSKASPALIRISAANSRVSQRASAPPCGISALRTYVTNKKRGITTDDSQEHPIRALAMHESLHSTESHAFKTQGCDSRALIDSEPLMDSEPMEQPQPSYSSSVRNGFENMRRQALAILLLPIRIQIIEMSYLLATTLGATITTKLHGERDIRAGVIIRKLFIFLDIPSTN